MGALALVLVAGAVLVGVTTSGSRSGSLSTTATKVSALKSCSRSLNSDNMPNVYLSWNIPADTPRGTTFRVFLKSTSPTYPDTSAKASKQFTTTYPSSSMEVEYTAANADQTYVLTWGRSSSAGVDDKYDEFFCAKKPGW